MRHADWIGSLDGRLIDVSKKMLDTCALVDTTVAIFLEEDHLLKNLFALVTVVLEFAAFEFLIVPIGALAKP